MTLSVVALVSGNPGPVELWTLRAISRTPVRLTVIQADRPTGLTRRQRFRRLRRDIGLLRLASRVLGNQLIGRLVNQSRDQHLDHLLDGEDLRRWWSASGLRPVQVPYLNHDSTRVEIQKACGEIVVRVSGGVLAKRIFSAASIATLNIHHGIAPRIRGMWSIPWGIVEDRPDWIGATIHVIDEGIDTGNVLWRSSPQISAGDTGTTLFFKAHLEAVSALAGLLHQYAAGATPVAAALPALEQSAYRTSPELPDWIRYICNGCGRGAAAVLRRAIEC